MTFIFEGREFAEKKEVRLKEKILDAGIKPMLVTIIIGSDPASVLYVNLKKKAAERIGAELQIVSLDESTSINEAIAIVKDKNNDPSVNGIMVQLPLPVKFTKEERDLLIKEISVKKDVDGLKKNSEFIPPTALAVSYIFNEAENYLDIQNKPGFISIVGGRGFIGSQIVRIFEASYLNKYKIGIGDKNTYDLSQFVGRGDVVISVTGKPGLIKKEMVKKGAVLIDVGSPVGDIEKEAYEVASFVSPVPGGVGPVTISCLLENLVTSTFRSA